MSVDNLVEENMTEELRVECLVARVLKCCLPTVLVRLESPQQDSRVGPSGSSVGRSCTSGIQFLPSWMTSSGGSRYGPLVGLAQSAPWTEGIESPARQRSKKHRVRLMELLGQVSFCLCLPVPL